MVSPRPLFITILTCIFLMFVALGFYELLVFVFSRLFGSKSETVGSDINR